MPGWKLDRVLANYGLSVNGDLAYKREFAVGAFLWSLLKHQIILQKRLVNLTALNILSSRKNMSNIE